MNKLTKIVHEAITAHEVMQQQAGKRFMVTIATGGMKYTSHYGNYAELEADLKRHEERNGSAEWYCNRADELLKTV